MYCVHQYLSDTYEKGGHMAQIIVPVKFFSSVELNNDNIHKNGQKIEKNGLEMQGKFDKFE